MTKEKDLITPPQDGSEQGDAMPTAEDVLYDTIKNSGHTSITAIVDAQRKRDIGSGTLLRVIKSAMHDYAQSQTAALRARVSMVTADDEHLRAEIERLRKEVERLTSHQKSPTQ